MTFSWRIYSVTRLIGVAVCLGLIGVVPASGQMWLNPPSSPAAQQNAMVSVRSGVQWLQNSARTAPPFGTEGSGRVWQQFQTVRMVYEAFKQTLTPQQFAYGANNLAELDAGLDILQEVFVNYQTDLAAGRPASAALRNMSQVLRKGSDLWLREFNKTCSLLRVGW